MKNFYSSKLQSLKKKSLYRQLVESNSANEITIKRGSKKFISFCCNDYLGLSQNSLVKKAAIAAIKKYGVGARASRYVTGNNSLYKKLESALAKYKKCDDAIVFSSGYAANIGVISALVGEGDLIIADRLIHSSLIDGAKLSGARFMRFLHNDVVYAKKLLAENRAKFKKCLIITETVFSMDGDVGEVEELLKLAQEFDCLLLSDDAHGLGLNHPPLEGGSVSEVNRGGDPSPNRCALRLSLKGRVIRSSFYLQIGTLSKAFGTLGGYVAGEKTLIDYLRNFSKSAIYSTALPPAILAASLASLKIISQKKLAKKTLENAEYFSKLMQLPKPQSAIVPIIIGDNKKVLEIAKKVADKGFLISAIRPPTVEPGKSRLRITFSSAHKKSQIEKLVNELKKFTN